MTPSNLLPPSGGKLVFTVSDLTRQVKELLERGFSSVWVTGEISNLARPPSGHIYLTLKDSRAQIRLVMWKGVAIRQRFDLKDGMDVIARGRLTVYEPRGEYQLQVEELHPKGIGAQELALRQLKEKLLKLGYFAPERKKPLPRIPRRLALVTSPTGAAVRDMLEMLGRRWPAVEVWVCPVRVQGAAAAEDVAATVRLLNKFHDSGALRLDVMIVGRGGGSSEDLDAFNAEIVAHAIFASKIPVVSAVGHEIDVTIADLVADHRALTPTHAASAVSPDRGDFLAGLEDAHGRMGEALTRRLELARKRLDDLAGRRVFRLPLERIRELEQRLDDWSGRLDRAVHRQMDHARQRLTAQAARLETLSPLNVLSRGYSLTRTEADRAVVRSPAQVRPGERLVTIIQHGLIVSRVEEVQDRDASVKVTDGVPSAWWIRA